MFIDIITYEAIIKSVHHKLGEVPNRISRVPAVFRMSYWPIGHFFEYEDEMLSKNDLEKYTAILEAEYYEEIKAIRKTLKELEDVRTLANWQKISNQDKDGKGIFESLNKSVLALNIWEEIGIPLRRKGDTIFLIRAPLDLGYMGLTPLVKSLPIDVFISKVAFKTASDSFEIKQLKERLDKWKTAFYVLAVIVGLIVWLVWLI